MTAGREEAQARASDKWSTAFDDMLATQPTTRQGASRTWQTNARLSAIGRIGQDQFLFLGTKNRKRAFCKLHVTFLCPGRSRGRGIFYLPKNNRKTLIVRNDDRGLSRAGHLVPPRG
jgi:hypothetical protein